MRIPEFKLPLCLGLLCVLAVVESSFAQGTLIGPETQNGSFEEGTFLPWFGNFSVEEDSSFATQGSWYALVQDSIVFAPGAAQNLRPDPNFGLLFLLTFDARISIPGYSLVTSTMSGRSPGGASLRAVVTPIAAPPLSPLTWQTYQYELQMPAEWDSSGFTFAIRFSRTSADGALRTAFLDNVVLTQIPEPAAVSLLALGGLLLAARLRRRSGAQANCVKPPDCG